MENQFNGYMFQGGPSQGGDNSNELSLPLPSTIRELEKVCFLPNLDFAYRTLNVSLITSLFFSVQP
jgi:hypothetical protein